jgi:hypothetical protein
MVSPGKSAFGFYVSLIDLDHGRSRREAQPASD